MTSHERFLAEAMRLAEQSVAEGGGPFGAVVVKNGEVVGRGRNRVTEKLDPTAHAEVSAIRDACARLGNFNLQGCVLYVNCEPCPMCAAACYWARIDAVWYAEPGATAAAVGFDDVLVARELTRAPGERELPFTRLAVPGSGTAFRLWSEKPDRIEY